MQDALSDLSEPDVAPTNLRRHSRLPPFAKTAKDGATTSIGKAREIESLGHPLAISNSYQAGVKVQAQAGSMSIIAIYRQLTFPSSADGLALLMCA